MQKLKAIIFDIDGTLANTVPLCIQAFRQALEPRLHRPLSDEEIVASFGPDEEGAIKSFAPDDYKEGAADFMRNYEALHNDMCPQPFDGINNLLDTLKSKGVRLAVVTGKGKDTSALSLQRFGLLPYFDMIENGSPEGSRKPEAIQKIVNAFGVPKEQVLYVGDTTGDIKESRQAGISVVAAAWAETADIKKLKEEQPDALFENVNDFAEWLYKRI